MWGERRRKIRVSLRHRTRNSAVRSRSVQVRRGQPNHTAGALYDLQAPSSLVTKPAGEWNFTTSPSIKTTTWRKPQWC